MENEELSTVSRAVRYNEFGDVSVLHIVEQPKPLPAAGQVIVRVKAAGINPGESAIREGKLAKQFPSTFPSGQGSDFAGIVDEVGEGVTGLKAGDEVIGYTNERNSHADYVTVAEEQLIHKPEEVTWEQAGGLFVAGTTAYAAVHAVDIAPGEIVIVSGAAGGVGSVVVQLVKNIGAQVIGIAGKANHAWLNEHNITPVSYGDNMPELLEQALDGKKPDAFIDLFGGGYVDIALKLGIKPERINTIIDFEAAEKYGVKTAGSHDAANPWVMAELADMVATKRLELLVEKTYPLQQVQDAYRDLEQRHTHGKIVLIP